jgi:hypothetical protein
VARVARNADVTPYNVDKLFWPIGSGYFYGNPEIGNKGRIGSRKKQFIEVAQTKLEHCVTQRRCVRLDSRHGRRHEVDHPSSRWTEPRSYPMNAQRADCGLILYDLLKDLGGLGDVLGLLNPAGVFPSYKRDFRGTPTPIRL